VVAQVESGAQQGPVIATISIRDSPQGVTFFLRVQPNASKNAIAGVFGDGENAALKLNLTAPPVEGRANEAAVEFLSEIFQVSRSQIQILKGESSRTKLIRISGKTAAELVSCLPRSATRS
jgi:uncharacterized protein (TIGR00251 family)